MKGTRTKKPKLAWGEVIDPVTGDKLTLGERVSWFIQGIIRQWAFLVIITIITSVIWATDNPNALLWWNLSASYLAIFIESVVGLSMFNQTKRDAVVIREIRALAKHMEKLEEAGLKQMDVIEDRIAVIEAQLEQ